MIGRVAFLNPATRSGIIFGSDRIRYTFSLADWPAAPLPQRNQDVNILVQDGHVTAVCPLGDEFMAAEDEPSMEAETPRSRKPRAGTTNVPLQAIEAFRGQMEYGDPNATIAPEEPAYAEQPLNNGEAFPEMFAAQPDEMRPAMGKLLFTMPNARSARSNKRLYAIGAGIVAMLAALAVAATHM